MLSNAKDLDIAARSFTLLRMTRLETERILSRTATRADQNFFHNRKKYDAPFNPNWTLS